MISEFHFKPQITSVVETVPLKIKERLPDMSVYTSCKGAAAVTLSVITPLDILCLHHIIFRTTYQLSRTFQTVCIKTAVQFVTLFFNIISIQLFGQFGQEPEPSQATGMALVGCILGKFLGVVCHCYL
jgi:hypothetical protein